MYDGLLNVYKEAGFTSHDVVAKLRGILRQKKIGHTGTLDPEAVGVLPVCLGKGTKLCDMLTDTDKTYEADMILGIATDTQDMTGTILTEMPAVSDRIFIEKEILSFVGDYDQIPPMYSAIKINGQKLCDLARQGKTVEREPRHVKIYGIDILSMDDMDTDKMLVKMRVSCSKGTYIRTLCDDIGLRLGCGGAMKALVRTAAAGFQISSALTLGQIEDLAAAGRLQQHVIPVDEVFKDIPAVFISEKSERLLLNGNPFAASDVARISDGDDLSHFEFKSLEDKARVRVYDASGVFRALFCYDAEKSIFTAEKMFL